MRNYEKIISKAVALACELFFSIITSSCSKLHRIFTKQDNFHCNAMKDVITLGNLCV